MRIPIQLVICILSILSTLSLRANTIELSPNSWWVGMKYNNIAIIAENVPLGIRDISINQPGVTLKDFSPAQNNTFYKLNIEISDSANIGIVPITFHLANNKTITNEFTILERTEHNVLSSLSASDVIYQIMPDRFCDGNTGNNLAKNYFEKSDRLNPGGVHGGDIEGIINGLPYISELGCTAIELSPVFESNLMTHSYDRMGTTNHFKIDKRIGEVDDYINLINKCQESNIKLIQSYVLHQIGKQHPWYKKMIDTNFFYQSIYNYEDDEINFNTLVDPYALDTLKTKNRRTWEQSNWPTLNQNNPLIQKLLIQHCIWWIETSGSKTIRINQAARNTPNFLSNLAQTLKQDYPNIELLLDHKSKHKSFSTWKKQINTVPFYYTDYSYPRLLENTFSTYINPGEGVNDLYNYAINQDIETDLTSKIICLDNLSLSRAYTNADSESDQLLMMVSHLLTSPGIVRILYGTEWQLKGNANKGVSSVRSDFPGGWNEDTQNGFTQEQMSRDKINFYRQLKAILQWRKANPDVLQGNFIHYFPINDIYAFARVHKDKSVLVVFNNSDQESYNVEVSDYSDILSNYTKGVDIITGNRYMDFNEIIMPAKSAVILELSNN